MSLQTLVTSPDRVAGARPHGFELWDVSGLHSIAHLVPKSKGRCGIYVAGFRNGDRYVGQALDVAARFRALRLRFGDELTSLAFRRVATDELDGVQREAVRRLESLGVALRNVVHAGGRLDAGDFELLVSPDEQRLFLASPRGGVRTADRRVEQPQQRERFAEKFGRLSADPRFAAYRETLRRYVSGAVPFPVRTELAYWSLSAMPSTNAASYPRLFTLSVNSLETLFLYAPKGEPERPELCLNVDLATLLEKWGSLEQVMARLPGVDAGEADYATRPGVATLTAFGSRSAARLLGTRGVLAAARKLNLDLMRKGPTMHWRSHCFDLADLAVA
ncbi:hypothetical protein [Winogradskya humida]|uniref:GIY-YIG nuclease family protein n=1 Tax=Winogradskya humida TaxID=113566 RepID=A0ABQ3ZT79_9ACTN|nr:hypothetical protein [Actinoplanes humidus]GIE21784.1 hypothetical protein Ahu01nite_048860 [Actinoplanes humidus]